MGGLLKVLIIEDSEFDTHLLLRLLRHGGYEVAHERVESAEGLKEALGRKEWDIIIADYNLPQFSAPHALEIVREGGRDIPFIIVSGGIGESTAVAAMKLGAHDYLMKDNLARLVPVVARELREALNREGKRLTKEALEESELRYRLLWETASDAVLLFDQHGRIHFANPAVEEVFKYRPSELIGREIFMLQPEMAQWDSQGGLRKFLQEHAPGRSWRARETVGLRKDGVELPVEAAFSSMQVDQKSWFVVFFRDITERKKAEKELLETQEQFRVAREIQQHLFPKNAPEIPGFDVAGCSLPADATGGDYFDYLPMLENCLGVVVGDVTGHGVGPALLMSETRAYLRILAKTNFDLGVILGKANKVMAEDMGYERYVTLFLARLNPVKKSLCYVNAGHIPGYILSSAGEVEKTLRRTAGPLGLRRETHYLEEPEIELRPGQVVLLLTDGFEEAVNEAEEMFGMERVIELVRRNRERSASEILNGLCESCRAFSGGAAQLDDLTAVVIKVK